MCAAVIGAASLFVVVASFAVLTTAFYSGSFETNLFLVPLFLAMWHAKHRFAFSGSLQAAT